MKAQELYDLRSAFEFCSGNCLSEFFAETVEEPSPSGKMEVPEKLARGFISESLSQIGRNSGGLDNLYSAPELAALFSICRVLYPDDASHQVISDSHCTAAISYAWSEQEAQAQAIEMQARYGNAGIRVRGEFVPDYEG